MPDGNIIGPMTAAYPEQGQAVINRGTAMIKAPSRRPGMRGGASVTTRGAQYARHIIFKVPTFDAARPLCDPMGSKGCARIRRDTADNKKMLVEGIE